MFLLGKYIKDVQEDDIKRLIDLGISESKTLEYKMELKIDADKDKNKAEFLADITALANTDGGIIIYGIKEEKDDKGDNTGIPFEITGIAIGNQDKLTQSVEDIIRSGTDPKINNPAIHFVSVEGKTVLLIGISKFAALPHMVTAKASNFFKRRNAGKYPVDATELNDMFMSNFLLKDRVKNFVNERIAGISEGSILPVVEGHGSLYIHVIPMSFIDENLIDLTSSENFEFLRATTVPLFDRAAWNSSLNIDGFYMYHVVTGGNVPIYCQVFRDGSLEYYTSLLCNTDQSGSKILIDAVEIDSYKTIRAAIEIYKRFKIEPPYVVFMNLRKTKECYLESKRKNFNYGKVIHREHISPPSVLIQTTETEIFTVMRPTFDILWQAGGYPQSLNYEKDGSVMHYPQ